MSKGHYTFKLLRQVVKDGDTCIDIGANVGDACDVMLECVGPTGKVFAVEPDPEAIEQLDLLGEIYQNLKVIAGAVKSYTGECTLYRDVKKRQMDQTGKHRYSHTVKVPESGEGISVPCWRLDDLFVGVIDCMIIGLRGDELEVLESGRGLLKYINHLFIFFWPCGIFRNTGRREGPAELLALLNENGFDVSEISRKTGEQLPINDQQKFLKRFTMNENDRDNACFLYARKV